MFRAGVSVHNRRINESVRLGRWVCDGRSSLRSRQSPQWNPGSDWTKGDAHVQDPIAQTHPDQASTRHTHWTGRSHAVPLPSVRSVAEDPVRLGKARARKSTRGDWHVQSSKPRLSCSISSGVRLSCRASVPCSHHRTKVSSVWSASGMLTEGMSGSSRERCSASLARRSLPGTLSARW